MGWGNRAWKWRSSLSSKIITINSDMLSLLLKNQHYKVEQIPLGVNLEYYVPQMKCIDPIQGISFSMDAFIIVSVVNLIPVKGIEFLIKAVQAIGDRKLELCIVGDDSSDYAHKLKKMVVGTTNIHFFGKQLDVRPFHAIADLFVIPTLALGEGLPMAPIEAMASERIVIGSSVPGVRDVLKDFQDCIFESDSVESLKNKIIEIVELPVADRLKLQSKMRTYVEQNFSMNACIDAHEKLYKDMVQ